jgi:hypothetical protein
MSRKLWLLLLCCWALTAWGTTPAESLRRLERAERALTEAERTPARAGALVREAAAQLPANACPALAEASAHPTKDAIARARRDVQALRVATGLQPRPGPSGAQAGAALGGVLARGEFSVVKPSKSTFHTPLWLRRFFSWIRAGWGRFTGWLSRVWSKIAEFLQRLFSRWNYAPGRVNSMGKGLRTVLIAAAVLAALLLFGFLLNRLLVYWQLSDRRNPRRTAGEEAEASERRYTTPWEQAMSSAEACWSRGEQREALRIVLRACLALLDGRGVLRYDESRANGEVLRELRRLGRSELHGPMRVIVRAFDRGWYGFLTITGDEFSTVLDTSRQLRTSIMEES